MAFIRPYQKSDFEATAHICRDTLPPSLFSSPAGSVLAPYLWTHQYTHLSPSTCFVLDDGTGTAVGYCIGCPDVHSFISAYPSYVAAVLDASPEVQALRLGGDSDPLAPTAEAEPWANEDGSVNGACLVQLAYDPQRLLSVDAAVAERFPATLHIDLLKAWQRKGWGGKLLERTVGALATEQRKAGQEGRPGGVWIGVAGDNSKVLPFYKGLGFRHWEDSNSSTNGRQQQQQEASQSAHDKGNGENPEAELGTEEGEDKPSSGSILLVREFLGAPSRERSEGGE